MTPYRRTLSLALAIVAAMAATVLLLHAGTASARPGGDQGGPEGDGSQELSPATPGQFLAGPNAGEPLAIALAFLQENSATLGLSAADLADYAVSDLYASGHSGVTHIYLQQQVNGLKAHAAILNVNIAADGSVINVGNRWIGGASGKANASQPALTAADAAAQAAAQLGLAASGPFEVLEAPQGAAQATVLSGAGVSAQPIPVYLVYQPAGDALRLAWNVTIDDAAGNHWWDVRVDAVSGELLHRDDWIDAETGAQESANPDEYVVFELPKESPSDGPRTTVVDPALPSASPFGWHDTDGAGGAEFTITRGNNAHGYADTDDDNMPDPIPGSEPDGGPGLVFDFPLDLNLDPIEYLSASVTNLFYFNNIIHDVFYGYGFDEASGNFQENNYGNGGLGSDYVFAEAQDGSGKNNANFGTPPDGQNPRMQMYRWNPPLTQIVEVLPPSPIAGEYLASPANFGPALTTTGITGTVTLVDDGVGTTTDGCEDLIGFPAGNVALIDRGTCTFVSKVLNAQEAGAIAVIVVNNVPGPPVTMGGDDPTVTISSVMISLDDGNEFKANLPLDANLRDSGGTIPARDSDLDNGVIAHEYGHGISNRLTGGPANVSCLNNEEQMGEGWSDYTALVLTAVASDLPDTPRGIGTYVVFQPPDGLGIRLFPYTTDMTVNPETYDSIKTNGTSPHSVGEVWTAMLWEVYWNLVDKHGFNADIYDDWTTGGNNLAVQLVVDGMKLQPCSPGFVDGRDAILAADMALTGGDNQCEIWEGFAKRGLGFSADQGSNDSRFDGTEAFDLPGLCAYASVAPPTQDVCAGDSVLYSVQLGDNFVPPIDLALDGEPAGVTGSFNPNPVPTVPSTSTLTVDTTAGVTPAGTYTLSVTASDAVTDVTVTTNLVVYDTVPPAAMLTSPADGAVDLEYQPLLTWDPVTGALGYEVEVATDAGFTNIVESATTLETEHQITAVLDPGTTYYWRVSVANVCGEAVSEVFSFTIVESPEAMCAPGDDYVAIYSENFDSGAPGWTHEAPTGTDTWSLVDTNPSPGSGSFAYHADDIDVPGEQILVSPEFTIPITGHHHSLQFLNEQIFEDPAGSGGCWDGGTLEVTNDVGASWTQINAELWSDPYDGVGNNGPPTGVELWCGTVAGDQPWLSSTADLSAYAGETVQFRFRLLSDAAVGDEGWYLDDFEVGHCVEGGPDNLYLPSILYSE